MTFTLRPLVIEGLSNDVNLSGPFLRLQKAKLDFEPGVIRMHGQEVQMTSQPSVCISTPLEVGLVVSTIHQGHPDSHEHCGQEKLPLPLEEPNLGPLPDQPGESDEAQDFQWMSTNECVKYLTDVFHQNDSTILKRDPTSRKKYWNSSWPTQTSQASMVGLVPLMMSSMKLC